MKRIQNIFWGIAKHHCSVFMVLLILALAWGGFLFFDNFLSLKEAGTETVSSKPVLDEEAYREILKVLGDRAKNLGEIESKTYSDPFQEAISIEKRG